jgi:hypothetical protein
VTGVRKAFGAVAGRRAELMDTAGLGLLVAAAFTWCVTAGLLAAGLGVLTLSWWLEQEGRR